MTALMFGLDVSTSAAPGADPVTYAQHAEELGFDFVSANDHPEGRRPSFELWTMLTWIAARTSRVKVATRVLGVPYRAPAMTAKMAETLDRLSGGRLILGLGGGASDDELRAFGFDVPSPREKVDGLEEAVRVIRGLWANSPFTYEGSLFHADDATLEPKPAHEIPIWLGTFGPRALAATGRVADGWIPSLELAPPEKAVVMRDRIFAAARAEGRDPERITCVYNFEVRVGEHDPRPHVVSGSPAEIAQRLTSFVALGFHAMNFQPIGPAPEEQAERLAREVIPEVRAAS